MTIGQLKAAIADLPDNVEIDIITADVAPNSLLLARIEPSDHNNTVAFFCEEPS